MTDYDENRPNPKDILKQEIDHLSDAHAEQVLHHVRSLRQVPESSHPGGTAAGQLDFGQQEAELVWWCARCETEFPRPLENPNQCPNCGAPAEDLVLREPTRRAA